MRWARKQHGGVKQIILKNEFIALLKHRLTESDLRQMGGKKKRNAFQKTELERVDKLSFYGLNF